MFKIVRQHAVRLGIFTLATVFLVVLVEKATFKQRAMQRAAIERAQLATVLPPTTHDNDLLADSFVLDPSTYIQMELLGLKASRMAYRAKLDNKVSAVILPLVSHAGYGGEIEQLIGISDNGEITGIRVIRHQETPGLGDKIDSRLSDWIYSFDGRSLNNTKKSLWAVKKDGGDFDQFVGATITPRAVTTSVYNSLEFFNLNKSTLLELATSDTKAINQGIYHDSKPN